MKKNYTQCCMAMNFIGSVMAFFVAGLPALAGSGSWVFDANSAWSSASRWSPAVVPGTAAGDVVYFTNNITASRTVTIDTTSRTVGTLIFADLISPYFNFTLIPSGGATLTFNNSGSGASLVQTNNASTSDMVSVPMTLAENLLVTNRGVVILSGAISGAGKSITKTGTGLLALAGTNSYSGGTIVNNGQLSFQRTASLPSAGTVTVANAATFALGAGGAGTFSASDIDALYANTFPGIVLGASSVAGVDTTLGDFTYTTSLSGTRSFAKLGANNLIFPVANVHSGATVIYGGVLELEHANALPGGIGTTGGTSALIFNGGAVGLGVGDFTRSLASASTVSGVNFTGPGGWAAYNADRAVNLGGAYATISWGTSNTGLNGQRLILGAPTATHTVEFQNPLNLGTNSRTVQVDDGAAAIDAIISAPLSGTNAGVNLYKTGSGTLALTATNTYIGPTWVNSAGTLLLTGSGSIGSTGANVLTLGQQYLGAGTLQYDSSATSYFSSINVSQSNAATGTLNQTSGMISVSGNVNLSPTADCYSFLNLSGGTLAIAGTLGVGQRGSQGATMVVSDSGVLTAGLMIVADISNPASPKPSYGQYTQNGGTATVGSLLMTKTSADTNPHVATFDLNGGTFSTAAITAGVATVVGGVNTSTFNFNGGTLKATASTPEFMQGLTATYVKEGGAVIDTDGYDITLAQTLLHAVGAAVSPLIKNGAGTLTLTGTNSLIGPVTVNGGTLALAEGAQLASGRLSMAVENNGALVFASSADHVISGTITGTGSLTKSGTGTLVLLGDTPYSGATTVSDGKLTVVSSGSLSNSAVTVGSGATMELHILNSGDQWDCSSLTLSGGTVTTRLRFYGMAPSASSAPLRVNGDLVNAAVANFIVEGSVINAGTYPLIQYMGEVSGSGSLGSVTLPNGGIGSLSLNASNKTIDLVVTTAVTPLVWNGGSGDWDVGITANWSGFRTTYLDGDLVVFDDTPSGTGPFTVTLPASINPNTVFFTNASKDYSLMGPGALSGEAGILKTGTGSVNLAMPNLTTGGLMIDSNAGDVRATLSTTQDSLGYGPVVIGSGSTLILENTNTTSASVVKENIVAGSGLLKVSFDTNGTARSTTLSGLSGFVGSIQVGSASSSTGDKLDVLGAQAPEASVMVEDGHTLQVGNAGLPVRLGSISVRGAGNTENRGALRFAANASTLETAIVLQGDTTLASDAAGAVLVGPIMGSATAGQTYMLTQGTAGSAAGLTLAGVMSDGVNGGQVGLTQSKGTLTLVTNNTYSGGTIINGGATLQLTGANDVLLQNSALVLGGTNGTGNGVGNLVLANVSQAIDNLLAVSMGSTYNTVTIPPGQTLMVSGTNGIFVGLDAGVGSETRVKMVGGGALVVTNALANVTLGKGQSDEAGTATSWMDLSDLANVTLGSSEFPINDVRVAYGQMNSATLMLCNTTNRITATNVHIANSFFLNGGSGTVILGSGDNTFAVNTINIGLYKGGGTLKFASQTAGSSGTLTIGGRTKPTTDIVIGSKGGMPSGAVPSGTVDLRGHDANITAGSVTIGREDNSTANIYTGGAIGWLYFDGGSFSMTNLVMAYKSGINTGVNARATATLTVSGGEFIIAEGGAFSFASQTGTGTATATNNILGGTFRSYANILTGPSNCLSVINLDGGTLDMTQHAIGVGAQTVTVFNARSGTLMNLGQFNNGAPLVKTGSGTLTLGGTNTYSGVTIVSNGVLRLTGGACLPATADLYLETDTTCDLDYTGTLAIHALYINGERKKGSLYNSTNLGTFLSGAGNLQLMYQGTLMIIQ